MTTRRSFLGFAGGIAGAAVAGQIAGTPALARTRFSDYPFSLGVASGDPLPDSVLLWTRIAPRPLEGGGAPDGAVPVQWKVCGDERMSQVVQRGTALARPDLGHSVHVDVRGLRPDREYFYQFRSGSELSPVARTRTAPGFGDSPRRLRLAVASCQNRPAGYYAAYRHMAEQDLDLVVHLGDYIYEGGGQGSLGRGHLPAREIYSLEDYRIRYAQYKTDPDLQAAHAACPWALTIDDHEVENNWADEESDPDSAPEDFRRRRAAAFQAYYEHQPLRISSLPQGPDMLLYRRIRFGDLAELSVLDTRQYRSDQACGGGIKERCAEALDPARTMTGPEQERWLLEGLDASTSRWNCIAQQTIMAELDFYAGDGEKYNMDNWGGYVGARNRILGFLLHRRPSNPVVLTGDIHATFVNDLKADFADESSATLGAEFATTSISSGKRNYGTIEAALPENPHVKYFNGRQRGYLRCEVTPEQWRSDLLFVDDPTDPRSPVRAAASYVIENGRPGAQPDVV